MTFLHQAVELALGTGVIGQSAVGLGPAVAASLALDGGWVATAARGRADRILAYLAGIAVGVPVLHFTLWPWDRRAGLPVLREAEGLPPSAMPGYNAVLYGWALAGAAGWWRDTPAGSRRWGLAGLASVAAFRPVAQRHFAWMAREAARNPRWWNRAWA